MTTAVFVYGTLKRGQCRECLWPRRPDSVQIGWVRGALYGRNDYPAMTAGDDRVAGELWHFDDESIGSVLKTLDQIEGTNQPGQDDLYHRVICEVLSCEGENLGPAWSYLYASDPNRDGFHRIGSVSGRPVQWP